MVMNMFLQCFASVSCRCLMGFILCLFGVRLSFAEPPATQPPRASARWDLAELKRTPAMRWIDQKGPIHSLLYSGEPFQGQKTEAFAFYASPLTIGEVPSDSKASFPAVVLIHGGGGTAFAEWTWLWAKRGYAAIAMDLSGNRPIAPLYDADGVPVRNQAGKPDTRTRLPNGGPMHGHAEKFDSIGGDLSDDWPYHAVANVVRAHSLLRSFPEVDANRTAVTGISWGGYLTCLVASIDDRFKAAVPVYGCGFLYDSQSVQHRQIDALSESQRQQWIEQYDPSAWLPQCRVPILFVNGTNDKHYPLRAYARTVNLVPGERAIRIEPNMRHSHPAGWAPEEIGWFVDQHLRGDTPLAQLGPLEKKGSVASATVTAESPI